ncbi:MAG TPA: type IV secretion system DNA-binding domain-containing protein [Candidatus Hydrogenedentes bacterium]|nr:type IV secretion system DNA-binding domain-containing protein [Candidatus Hydrogenedentota bacterium]
MPNHKEFARFGLDREKHVTPDQEDEPLVWLVERRNGAGQEGVFAVELAGVTVQGGRHAGQESSPDENAASRLVASVFSGLSAGEGIELVYRCGKDVPFTWQIVGHVSGQTQTDVISNAKRLYTSLCASMRTESAAYRFSPVRSADALSSLDVQYPWQRRIQGQRVAIQKAGRNPMGFAPGSQLLKTGGRLVLPDLTPGQAAPCNRLVSLLRQSPTLIELRLTLAKVILDDDAVLKTSAALEWLLSGEEKEVIQNELASLGERKQVHIGNSCRYLNAWLDHGWGVRLTATVASEHAVTPALLTMIADDLTHGKNTRIEDMPEESYETGMCTATGIDFQDCLPAGRLLPSFFPAPAQLVSAQVRREYNREVPRLGTDGIILGRIRDGVRSTPVHFRHHDRTRHVYILGSTGTGKSTLLANMIIQDIRNGHGVSVLDPHGDLYTQILENIPPERVDDLILINPCDTERAVGINFLEAADPSCRKEMHLLVNEMMSIFKRLYMRETQGPIFETYMRNAMLLVMENEIPGATLLDIPRLFEHDDFRNALLAKCHNRAVLDFWRRTAERANGEYSLANMTAYVTSKLNMFIYNSTMRCIIGQAKSTIDFYQAINEGRIILVNLSKGLLGELDTQLLGMLITGKLFCAALNRASEPTATPRKSHFLYIDEFQNFTSGSVAQMLSEARKFGLYLTLANQNLSQLREGHEASSLSETVLSNAGTLLCFRTGAPDAERIEQYTLPEFGSQDIQYMPDFHLIAKLLVNQCPSRPFVFETLPFETAPAGRGLKRSIENARKRYTVDIQEVERDIASRHAALQIL